jgi:dihydroorotate dehydrogenase (NAD+) catalytic subunit
MDLSLLGAVVVKSLAAFAWAGNPAPRVVGVAGGMLNSVGLQGPGVEAWMELDLAGLLATGARVVASIWGRTPDEYAAAAAMLAGAPAGVVAVEVNVSCPNLSGPGLLDGRASDGHLMFAHSAAATAEVVEAAAACGRPRWAKLSPNVADITEIAGAALGAGAEALTLVNTSPGLAIDLERRAPRLGAGGGGLSGPALHPVAVRAVFDCRSAFHDAGIVGVGGVTSGVEALELVMAGANAVQVGTATFADPRAAAKVSAEVASWCARHQVSSLSELVGAAQPRG